MKRLPLAKAAFIVIPKLVYVVGIVVYLVVCEMIRFEYEEKCRPHRKTGEDFGTHS